MARSRQTILDATRELLAHDGDVGALTVEAVAARSGVAKTTIYRRWRDKWQLALDGRPRWIRTPHQPPQLAHTRHTCVERQRTRACPFA